MNCTGPTQLISYFAGNPACAEVLAEPVFSFQVSKAEYFRALGMTLVFEFPIYFLILQKKLKLQRLLIAVLVINLLTHPAVWFLWPKVMESLHSSFGTYVAVGEVFAPTAEAIALVMIFKISPKIAILASILANLFSWGLGAYLLSA